MDRTQLELQGGRLQHRAFSALLRRVGRLAEDVAVVEGVKMPYLHGGTGPPLVFLHGFADQKETWTPIAPLLARAFTVIAPDLPGYGAADEVPPTRASLKMLARHLGLFLDTLGRRRVHLVGNSMGGGVALRFAADYPERVASLSLLASVGPETKKSEAGRLFEHGDNPLIPGNLEEYRRMLTFVFAKQPPFPRWLQTYMAERQAAKQQRFRAYFEVLSSPPKDEGLPVELEDVDIPSVVIHGTRDRVIHPMTAHNLAQRLPQARHVVLPGVGHGVQWEAPVRTQNAIEEVVHRATRQEMANREER